VDQLAEKNWPVWGYSLTNMAIVLDFEETIVKFLNEADAGQILFALSFAK
jgi:hypothetical protein